MTPRVRSAALLTIAAIGVTSLVSCGGSGSDLGTTEVTGIVTLDDKPVANATVNFTTTKKDGHSAQATTDSEGRYTLSTFVEGKGHKGAMPGEYKVSVIKTSAGDAPEDEDDPNYEKYISQGGGGDASKDKIKHIVPEKYNDPEKSGITVTVEAGKENDIPIKLSSK